MVKVENRADKGQPYLQIRHLSKAFGRFVALSDISLDVYEGEFICFLGPSGCGKTTLLRCIAGLEEQNSGQVIQAGRDISQLPPSKRDFGIVFQSYALFPNLTAAKNIAYGLENQKLKKSDIVQRVQELLELVGLADAGHKYPAQLSGGQQQRIALARALALSPGLLLLDEPLSALDARVRASLRNELSQLQRRLGVTTVMVTHDQEEALTMADRIVVMDHGVIMQVGTPLEIYQQPSTPFVAHFIGEMNFLTAVLTNDSNQVRCGNLLIRVGNGPFDKLRDRHQGTPGSSVTLAIRPEDVRVRNVNPNSLDTLMTHITNVEFLGSFYRLRLAIDNLDHLGNLDHLDHLDHTEKATLVADLAINVARDLTISEGAALPIQLPAETIRVFSDGPRG